MSGEITITPGKVWDEDVDALTEAALNAAATPTARVDEDSIGTRELIVADVQSMVVNTARATNYLANGAMWRRTFVDTSGVACPAGEKTENARRWWIEPTGAAASCDLHTAVPTNNLSGYSLRVIGASSVTAVDIGQTVPSSIAKVVGAGNATVSLQLYNNTGASFDPVVVIKTLDAVDGAASTQRTTSTLATCAANAWTALDATIDLSALTNIGNGFELIIQIPSGNLNATGKQVYLTQLQLEAGAVANTFVAAPDTEEVRHNLAAGTAPTATDDSTLGYGYGSLWQDISVPQVHVCSDPSEGAAVWTALVQPAATNDVILLRDVQSSGTAGGTATAGSWQDRTLNEETVDTAGICALDGGNIEFTLEPGTYEIDASCPAYSCAGHQARLYNVTGSAALIYGTSEYAHVGAPGGMNRSFIKGRFTLSAQTTLKIQHRVETTAATNGFGEENTFGNEEVYSVVWLRRTAT